MPAPDFAGAVAYALSRLRDELPPSLTYHNSWHTEHDVLPAAVRLAQLSGLSEDDTALLRVAAAFHDIGFVATVQDHEIIGAAIATSVLPRYGFQAAEIDCIGGMILTTRMPQRPRNLLEEILADADLDVLGRDDFASRNRDLRGELAALGQVMTDREWLISQAGFLEQHTYFTDAARSLRAAGKQANLAQIMSALASA